MMKSSSKDIPEEGKSCTMVNMPDADDTFKESTQSQVQQERITSDIFYLSLNEQHRTTPKRRVRFSDEVINLEELEKHEVILRGHEARSILSSKTYELSSSSTDQSKTHTSNILGKFLFLKKKNIL